MTSIKLLKAIGGNSIGDTIEVTPGSAAYLIKTGNAEASKAPRKTPAKTGEKAVDKSSQDEVGGASPKQSDQTAG